MGGTWDGKPLKRNVDIHYGWWDASNNWHDAGGVDTIMTLNEGRTFHTNNAPDSSGFRGPSNYNAWHILYDTYYRNESWSDGGGHSYEYAGFDGGYQGAPAGIGPAWTSADGIERDDNLCARSLTECLDKLADVKSQVIQNLVTARKTADLLADSVFHLSKFLINMRRMGSWAKARQSARYALDDFANLYLMEQFGWRPLVNDVMGALDVWDNKDFTPRITVTRKCRNTAHGSYQRYGYNWSGSYHTYACTKIWAQVDDTWTRNGHRLGLDDPLWILWDLVPWSFVVDWVLPIGSVLEGLNAGAGLTFKAGYTSWYTEGEITIYRDSPPGASGSPGGGKITGRKYQRRVMPGFPLPQPYVKSPFSVTHALESLALLRQMRHG